MLYSKMEYYVLSILFQQRWPFFYSSRAVTLCTKQCFTVSGVEECEWHSQIHYSYPVPLGWIGKADCDPECFAWCYYCLTFLILLCLLWSKSLQLLLQKEWLMSYFWKWTVVEHQIIIYPKGIYVFMQTRTVLLEKKWALPT